MIDRYHPDLLYSDSPLPYPDEFGRKLLAHYYNDNRQQHGGKLEAVYNCKQDSQGMWVQDLERGVMDKISPHAVADRHLRRRLVLRREPGQGPPLQVGHAVLQMLADIVSKNGNLLLNFPPRPDGTLDDDELKILDAMAAWMPVNGEAIFGTRPWKVFGEGPGKIQGGMFNEGRLRYTARDIRFTTKGETLYALALAWPADRQAGGQVAGQAGRHDIRREPARRMPASSTGAQTEQGLLVTLPEQKPCEHVFVLKIAGSELRPAG